MMAFWIVSNIVLNTLIGLSFSKERTKSGEIFMYDVAYVTEIPQRNKLVTIPHRVSFLTFIVKNRNALHFSIFKSMKRAFAT
jgi:hypothetical protein